MSGERVEALAEVLDEADNRWQHGVGASGYDPAGPPIWLAEAVIDSDWLRDLIAAERADAAREALESAADDWLHGAWGNTPRHRDQIADRIGAAQYAGDWLRARAEALRAASGGAP